MDFWQNHVESGKPFRLTSPCSLCSSALSPACAKKDGDCQTLTVKCFLIQYLKTAKMVATSSSCPSSALPLLRSPKSLHELHNVPCVQVANYLQILHDPKDPLSLCNHSLKSTLIIFCSPGDHALQGTRPSYAPCMHVASLLLHVQDDLVHCRHHPDNIRLALECCLHDWSPAMIITIPLVD